LTSRIEHIQAAFAAEEGCRHAPVYKAHELPLSYEAITNDWLTDTLCAQHPSAQVISHHLGPVDSGSSNRRKIAVQYNEAGQAAGLPTALFCKSTHDLSNRIVLGISGGALGEVSFYNCIRPLLEIEAPQSFFANYDAETVNSIIMLRDISETVTSFCDHHTNMTRARAESQLRLLATYHGKGYADAAMQARLKSFVTWPEFFGKTLEFDMMGGSNQGFLDAVDVIPHSLYKRFDAIWPATLASVEAHNHLPQTLCHGDVHLKNWYIAGNGEMGLSDWQCVHRGHWSRDFAYAMSCALTIENRRAWEQDLLRLYLDAMHAAGGPNVPFDEAWLHYRQQLVTALTWWTVTLTPPSDLPDMQPRDITLAFIQRIATAMDDVDSLGSFS